MGNQKKFLKNLFDILNSDKFEHIICWTVDGNQILMKSPKNFEEQVMPEFFNSTKVTTFYRQLNQYGFKFKQNQKREKVFWLEQFRRDNYNELFVVQRRKREEVEGNENLQLENKKLRNQLKLLQKQQQQIQAQLRIHTQIYGIIFNQLQNILAFCMQDADCSECETFFQAILNTFMGFKSDIAQDIIEDLKFFGQTQTPQLSPLLFPYFK